MDKYPIIITVKYYDEVSDTLKTINRINTNEAYYKKTGKGKYEVIGIFYDAIYKYSVLFDDVIYYDKYI